MPRCYNKKTTRRTWKDDDLISALHAVNVEKVSCNSAAAAFEIPEATLRRYLKTENEDMPVHGGRFRNTFSDQQLEDLRKYLTEINMMTFGLNTTQCRKLVYEYAEMNKIPHRFNKEAKMAGMDWLRNFMKMKNFTLRSPEATSIGRVMGFNRVQVEKFFNLLKEVRQKNSFPPHRIFNVDESGLSTVPSKMRKVLSPKGIRRVAKIVSAERGKTITIVCAMNACGMFVPPFLIFPRKRMNPDLLDSCPPGTVGHAHDTGYMTTEIFTLYLEHFVEHTKPSVDTPILLLLDNHASHLSLDAINVCRERGIVMVGFPPHTSHRLQPLDVSFFGPLKKFYSEACDNFMISNPGKAITERQIGSLLCKAYHKAATVGNAVSGFRATGIEPYDAQLFGEEDFLPSVTTERENDNCQADVREGSPLAGPSYYQNPDENQNNNVPMQDINEASPAEWQNNPTPWDVQPLPKAARPLTNRKRMGASEISSSPVKLALEEKKRVREMKEQKKEERKAKALLKKKCQIQNTTKTSIIQCPACNEVYEDPPHEDWIECDDCKAWWHEACSNYEGRGIFTCDYC